MKYINKIITKNHLVFQFVQRPEKGIMLTPALWVGKGSFSKAQKFYYSIGFQIEWINWTVVIGITYEKTQQNKSDFN